MLRRPDKAFAAFFRRVKAGQEPGYPRFKSRSRFKSLEYRHGDGCKVNGNRLYVQRAGDMKVKLHRPLPEGATIKHVVLKRSLDKWYVALMLDIPDPEPRPQTGLSVAIDVGLYHLLAFSNGETVDNPRWLRQSLKKLRVAQRHLSRCQKGSNRRRKAARRVAAIHEKTANQRLDFWHKRTRSLVEIYDTIGIEELNLSFMTHNGHLALSAHDAALGTFRQLLVYKAEEAGRQWVAVNPRGTSQACSDCAVIVPKNLTVRVHRCACGLTLDRDVNAARHILNLARTGPSQHGLLPGNLDVGLGAPRSSPLLRGESSLILPEYHWQRH